MFGLGPHDEFTVTRKDNGQVVAVFLNQQDAILYAYRSPIEVEVADSQGFAVTLIERPSKAVAQRVTEIMARSGCSLKAARRVYRREQLTGQPQEYRSPGRPKLLTPASELRIAEFIAQGAGPVAARALARREQKTGKRLEYRGPGRPEEKNPEFKARITELVSGGLSRRAAYQKALREEKAVTQGLTPRSPGRPSGVDLSVRYILEKLKDQNIPVTESEAREEFLVIYAEQSDDPFIASRPEDSRFIVARRAAVKRLADRAGAQANASPQGVAAGEEAGDRNTQGEPLPAEEVKQ